jgi:pyruvate,water dikinase
MLIDAIEGLAAAMVRGEAAALTILARRSHPGQIETPAMAEGTRRAESVPGRALLAPEEVRALVEVGLTLEAHRGRPLDLEWVLTRDGTLRIVQCRPLRMVDGTPNAETSGDSREPLSSGGMTVFPGRAVGPLHLARTVEEIAAAPDGAILVLRQAVPELAAVLPRVAGVVAEHGNLAGHAAALAREFAVPTLFGVPDAEERLGPCKALSLDATRRLVFEGILWPEVSERTRSRIRHLPAKLANPLHERVLALHLTDPMAISFRPRSCRSVHDIVRFTHEKAVAAMFDLGDEVGRHRERGVCRMESELPISFSVLDLGGALPAAARERRIVRPEEIVSPPFRALWRGMTRPGVTWTGRTQISLGGFMSVVASSMSDSRAGIREVGGRNYLMVAPDYVNLNARLAYHFAMVDAFVSPVPENNFVNFRFRGGGAGEERRDLRGQFLAEVLLRSGFGVDRRGDLVTAWLRRYPRGPSEDGLATLGTLMACARQLDMLMQDESAMRHFVESFLRADFAAFT